METAENLKKLYEITKVAEKQLESHFKDSEYRPIIIMMRRDGAYDHGVLAFALGAHVVSNHDHSIGKFSI
ncbi:hypothetical protein BSK49_19130 [Paenibacillus odorifer]|uniref:Uncharacterized protein n=1 Tax=Paenibacillus odorifer TaxID=189426 RepID=A0ABX3GQC6_9BACL|nr:hypothetical protein [Paenibacillus odorifer]OMD34658.1 hypothetical protein BSO21_10865 [Paenibacillus odorifer]OMD85631.1 hypothetical protein BSK49_19130 [Paenibacillus odorifer]